MKRRHLLLSASLLSGTSALRSATAWADTPVPSELAICGTATSGLRRVRAAEAGTLAYEGTHILAYGAMRELSAQFAAMTGQTLAVQGGGCDDAIAALRKGVADFGGLCCPVNSTSIKDLPSLVVAHDFKAVVVHPSNPVSNISKADLIRVASGGISHWRELGGTHQTIALVVRRHCPDYIEPVRSALLNNLPLWSSRGLFVQTDEKIAETTARFEGALGIVSWVYAKPLVERGQIKLLCLNHIPLVRSSGLSYPLTGPLSLAFNRWDDKRMRPFMDFLYSSRGQAVMARALIPVSATAAAYHPKNLLLSA